jgi:sulfur-carrier protein adenylyltransferase/sulfurtransferase
MKETGIGACPLRPYFLCYRHQFDPRRHGNGPLSRQVEADKWRKGFLDFHRVPNAQGLLEEFAAGLVRWTYVTFKPFREVAAHVTRHARQEALPDVGSAGQARIRAGKVLVVGLGGLGSPAAHYLAGAGVGRLGLCDFDTVDVSNLHRQTLYDEQDVGRAKVEAAVERLRRLDASLDLVPIQATVSAANAARLVGGWDVVLDCTDDLDARYALSDACVAAGIPLVHGAVSQWEGACTVLGPPGPCYRCLFPSPPAGPPATCATEGVLGTVPGIVGAWQAQEALKILLGAGTVLRGRMLLLDGREGATRTISLKRRKGCICFVHELPRTDAAACPTPWATPKATAITMAEYEATKDRYFLLDVREPWEAEEVSMPDANVIPLGQLEARVGELPRGRPIACLCAVGARSAHAAAFLRSRGYDAVNLRGGIQAWLQMQG